ncbi:MAG: hypothetical protein KatS3mg077_0675 [Candidatus Binatia bacterium]|nr:MAG: hypothetical protein KatS3mg077_0675 [Candidatus Binatia bacterium]
MRNFRFSSLLPCSAEFAYAWHTREGAFERLAPPWVNLEVERRQGTIHEGEVVLRLPVGPFPVRWHAQHYDGKPGEEFRDRMVRGPFVHWEHVHRFVALDSDHCRAEDHLTYQLLRWPEALDRALDAAFVRRELQRMFAYRHRVLGHDLHWHATLSAEPMTFLVTGATGLIGSTLCPFLSAGGHKVLRATRTTTLSTSAPGWNPRTGEVRIPSNERVDAIVHLAGANVGESRWTPERKAEIRSSRVEATARLAEHVAGWKTRPRVFVAASAIGFYGDRGAQWLDEDSPPGRGFLPSVCQEWEAAVRPLEDAGVRVVRLRIGVVLTPKGGALKRLLWPFWLGLGGRTGDGRQFMSWIAPDDLAAAILFCVKNERLHGPVNAVSPNPVTNTSFTRALARALRRPAVLPLPAAAVRLLFGEMGEELVLSSTRVRPARLLESGFQFRYPTVDAALAHVLGASRRGPNSFP